MGNWNKTIIWCVLIVCFTVILSILALKPQDNKQYTVRMPSVPDGYHLIYDDNNKMMIVPNEWHLVCDEQGVLTMEK